MKKSQLAGILFGVAMGVLFSVSMGTVGFVLGASFASLGMVMFKGLDDPQDKKVRCKKMRRPCRKSFSGKGGAVFISRTLRRFSVRLPARPPAFAGR